MTRANISVPYLIAALAVFGAAGCADEEGPTGFRVVQAFDPAVYELPEGVALRDGSAFVSIAPSGAILEVDAAGTVTPFGTVPAPAANMGYVLGLAFDPGGDLFVAVGSFDPAVTAGVYRVPAAGGAGALFATHATMAFPNAIAVSGTGELFVSDSATGTIFRAATDGTTEPWLTDALLLGSATPACGSTGVAFPIGANGIVHDGASVVVANTDLAHLVRIPIEADGSAGRPAVAVGPDCASLFGVDGLASDGAGGFYATVQIGSSVARIAADGAISELGRGAPLDGPASVAVGDLGGERSLVVTSSAFGSIATPGATPQPGVVAATL